MAKKRKGKRVHRKRTESGQHESEVNVVELISADGDELREVDVVTEAPNDQSDRRARPKHESRGRATEKSDYDEEQVQVWDKLLPGVRNEIEVLMDKPGAIGLQPQILIQFTQREGKGHAGKNIAHPPTVQLTQGRRPLGKEVVRFTITNGRLSNGLKTQDVTTDQNGVAQLNGWHLGEARTHTVIAEYNKVRAALTVHVSE